MCPRYVILFGHFSKRDQKESHFFPQKKKKRRKIYLDSFRRFPISLHFLKKTHLLSLFFFFFFFFREREKEREKRERERDKVRKFESEQRDDHFKTTL
jgi:hypothetical protein